MKAMGTLVVVTIFVCCIQCVGYAGADEGLSLPGVSPGSTASRDSGPSPNLPPVGFVTHFNQGDFEALSAASVTAELADLIHWRMRDLNEENPQLEHLYLDLSPAESWLSLLEATGRQGFPIIDTSLHHTNIPWRQEMTRRVNENLVGADGKVWNHSSLHSPLFQASVLRYMDQFIAWFREHDTGGHVRGYLNGAEWFYPGTLDYSPLALAAYRSWLAARYGDVASVNQSWGADFDAWDSVMPPRFHMIGGVHATEPTFVPGEPVDASFMSGRFSVEGGRLYAVSAQAEGTGAVARLSVLHIAWFDNEGVMLHVSAVPAEDSGPNRYVISGEIRAPESATAVEFHCKLTAPGEVVYVNPEMRDLNTGRVLTARAPDSWRHVAGVGASTGEAAQHDGVLRLTMRARETTSVEGPAHPSQALDDWVLFSFEAMADWLNVCAEEIKQRDPARYVVSYVGFVFAQQAQWDYAMVCQRLDISLANTPAIDINGIQMCIADNDYSWATHVLDMARKYGKPVWATDLIDFPYGLYSGFEAIYRGTLAAIQHGMEGVFWYGWKGVPDYAFSQRMATPDRERLLRDSRTALEALRGYRPHVAVAQLMPLLSYSTADEAGFKGDMLDNGGLYRLLLDMGITPDIWTPYELEHQGAAALTAYEVVFVSDCPVLPAAVYDRLLAHVKAGGVIISSGRLPAHDLRGEPFGDALADHGGVISLGKKIGREYWGRVRREQVYGNTPPVLVEAPDSQRTPLRRRALRSMAQDALNSSQTVLPLRLIENEGNAHVTPFYHAEEDAWLLFLVHHASGRCHHVDIQVALDGRRFTHGRAWCDFDARHDLPVHDDGSLRVPDFAHSCLVYLFP